MGITLTNPNRGRNECLTCGSRENVNSLRFARGNNNGIIIDLCKNCRNLLHKKLHEEDNHDRD